MGIYFELRPNPPSKVIMIPAAKWLSRFSATAFLSSIGVFGPGQWKLVGIMEAGLV